jgi:phosphoenolpyruvate carboxylase
MSPQMMPSDPDLRSNRADEALALEEDARLRNDIRLLGRILGDTVRDQEGADVFDLVERIRQTSIRFHRDDDEPARRELEAILDGMSTGDTVRIVRAFSYFSHLANIAEDQNNIRQMRTGRCGPARPKAACRDHWRSPCRTPARPASARRICANSSWARRSVRF